MLQRHRLRLLGGDCDIGACWRTDGGGGGQDVQWWQSASADALAFSHQPLQSVFLLRQQSTLLPCASVRFTTLDLSIEAKKRHHAHHII